jgi:hypothetical protein
MDAPQSDHVPISGTDLGTVRIPFTLDELEDQGIAMALRRYAQFRLLTLD